MDLVEVNSDWTYLCILPFPWMISAPSSMVSLCIWTEERIMSFFSVSRARCLYASSSHTVSEVWLILETTSIYVNTWAKTRGWDRYEGHTPCHVFQVIEMNRRVHEQKPILRGPKFLTVFLLLVRVRAPSNWIREIRFVQGVFWKKRVCLDRKQGQTGLFLTVLEFVDHHPTNDLRKLG